MIFDYDGVVVDSERALADLVIEIVAERGGAVGYTDFGHLFGTVDADDVWDALVPTWCDGFTGAELDRELSVRAPAVVEHLPPLEGVRELLAAARADGWRIGLGTGADRERLERRLARNELFELFDAIVTRADVSRGKPEPDIFLEVARRLDVDPDACVVLEDSPHGCQAGIAAGMRVIACPSVVTAHCVFPDGVARVTSLLEISLGGEGGI